MSYNDVLKRAVEITSKLTDEEFQQVIIKAGLDKIEFDPEKYKDDGIIEILLPEIKSKKRIDYEF